MFLYADKPATELQADKLRGLMPLARLRFDDSKSSNGLSGLGMDSKKQVCLPVANIAIYTGSFVGKRCRLLVHNEFLGKTDGRI